MLLLRKPRPTSLLNYLAAQVDDQFSYPEVGATKGRLPAGYAINHTRRQLGKGDEAFDAACAALRSWSQLQLGWVSCWPLDAPMIPGQNIVVVGRAFGLWWLNACRIAYVMDETLPGNVRRYGYAHGTLRDHLACGEERFLIEMEADGAVWLDILAFSRPNSAWARLGYAYMRSAQRRFGRESADKMIRTVASSLDATLPASDDSPGKLVPR